MPDAFDSKDDPDRCRAYQIRIGGRLGREWTDWFDGLSISAGAGGETLLTGAMDQAALYGALKKVRDLGIPLLSVNPVTIKEKK